MSPTQHHTKHTETTWYLGYAQSLASEHSVTSALQCGTQYHINYDLLELSKLMKHQLQAHFFTTAF